MSKKDRFLFDPLEDELVGDEMLNFIGKNTLGQQQSLAMDDFESFKDVKKEKKICSYYLEKDLVQRLKGLAHLTELSYSRVVSKAISEYVEEYGF